MTIEVIVKNNDGRENAIIKVATVAKGSLEVLSQKELKGKEEATFYVHSDQSLAVSEVRNG